MGLIGLETSSLSEVRTCGLKKYQANDLVEACGMSLILEAQSGLNNGNSTEWSPIL